MTAAKDTGKQTAAGQAEDSRQRVAAPEWALPASGVISRLARRLSMRFDRQAVRLERRARHVLGQMSVAEKIGQLVVPVIFPANAGEVRLGEEIRALVAEQHIGGYFICAAGASAERVRAFTDELQATARIPLILASDFEGGGWNFLRSAVGPRPWPADIAAMDDPKVAFYKGAIDAELLASLGVNVNFAPSVDVLTNPDNPILQRRTFGASPDQVTRLAAAYVDGLAAGGVAGCLKHFPGLGAATVDPHTGLPLIMRTREEITGVELWPYRSLLHSGHAPMIMTTHMLMPALDSHLPTSLSPIVIDDLLRRVLEYDGVVISDSLAMGGVTGRYSVAEAAVLALEAGTDLLLGASSFDEARESVASLKEALADERVTAARVDEAVLRVLRFKLRWRIIP